MRDATNLPCLLDAIRRRLPYGGGGGREKREEEGRENGGAKGVEALSLTLNRQKNRRGAEIVLNLRWRSPTVRFLEAPAESPPTWARAETERPVVKVLLKINNIKYYFSSSLPPMRLPSLQPPLPCPPPPAVSLSAVSFPTDDIVGRLQTSLSHALHHFCTLAGRLAAPSPDGSGTLHRRLQSLPTVSSSLAPSTTLRGERRRPFNGLFLADGMRII